MDRTETTIVHVAGEMVNMVQTCTRCGIILSDYRNAMWLDGQPAPKGIRRRQNSGKEWPGNLAA